MNAIFFTLIPFIFIIQACGQQTEKNSKIYNSSSSKISINSKKQNAGFINPVGMTIGTRILTPAEFLRIKTTEKSFAGYLRSLPLRPDGSVVKLYNGQNKPNQDIYDAVVDLPIGNRDLHQCADAVIRLRAEYLFYNKGFSKIHFNFTNGFSANYNEWMNGKRITINGNKTYWVQSALPSTSYKDFWKYLEIVFSYAGTLSLSKELKGVNLKEMQIGDIFIRGGSPGHAVIIVDMAANPQNGRKIFLLAQSYMPAQEIQILKNPNNSSISPWYDLDFGDILKTPEWTFNKHELKRFEE